LQRCFVWPRGSSHPEPWRCIAYNISSNGLGITMPFPPQPGTLLQVEAWNLPGARPIEVRVVRASAIEFLWFCGCEFIRPLAADELLTWTARTPDLWIE
jgi:PilZ domain